MHRDPLPDLEFVLTPHDRDTAARAALHLEDNRRRRNDRDREQERAEEARALARALEPLE